jgi:excisionase family DNA binding protein
MPNQSEAPQMLTPDDVAARLKMNPDHIRRLFRSGEIPGVKIGRAWRVSSDKLAAWIESKSGTK